MSIRGSLHKLRLAVGFLAIGVSAAFVLPATTAVAASPANAAPAAQVPVPVRNGSAREVAPYAASQTIRLAIGLKVPNEPAEQQFLQQIQDKTSPLFHHYLSVAQWTARFGPTAASQRSVVSWATGAGLTATSATALVAEPDGLVATARSSVPLSEMPRAGVV